MSTHSDNPPLRADQLAKEGERLLGLAAQEYHAASQADDPRAAIARGNRYTARAQASAIVSLALRKAGGK